MLVHTRSTQVTVRDPKLVREVLKSYHTHGIKFRLRKRDEIYTLDTLSGPVDSDVHGQPTAIHVSRLPNPAKYPTEKEYRDALRNLLLFKGTDGFVRLLVDLIPFLEGPWLIVSRTPSNDLAVLCVHVWSVLPDGVQMLQI
jgi:hypothetical protein